jgi:hypothetical protein
MSAADWFRRLLEENTYAEDQTEYRNQYVPDDLGPSDIGIASLGSSNQFAITNAATAHTPTKGPTMAKAPAYAVRDINGAKITNRTLAMLAYAQNLAGFKFRISQGGFKPSTPSSGSTHNKEALDIGTRELSATNRKKMIRALKDAGFAVWYRAPNWDGKGGAEHAHALPIGGQLSDSASRQVAAYLAGRNGLNDNAPDRTYRANVRYNYQLGRPTPR